MTACASWFILVRFEMVWRTGQQASLPTSYLLHLVLVVTGGASSNIYFTATKQEKVGTWTLGVSCRTLHAARQGCRERDDGARAAMNCKDDAR